MHKLSSSTGNNESKKNYIFCHILENIHNIVDLCTNVHSFLIRTKTSHPKNVHDYLRMFIILRHMFTYNRFLIQSIYLVKLAVATLKLLMLNSHDNTNDHKA